ncbi:HelD family protein, partial [Frankia sp. CcWB2]
MNAEPDVDPVDLTVEVAAEVAGPDAELAAEREHLRRSRRALAGMRAEIEGTEIAAGDAVVDKVTNAYLKLAKQRRLASFTEQEDSTPLFFARVDYGPDAPRVPGQCFYLGRRHVREAAGDDPLVVDWRTEVARPFYRAHPGDPMGLTVRRRFGYDGAELTAFEDEPLVPRRPAAGKPAAGKAAGEATGPAGGLLDREIERPRTGPMRDIIATIQPEQDEIVRADLAVSVCVQGAPGTGKTAVGLHRAAYLLYAHREQLRRSGVLVVGPNRAFLGYIAAVLPSLGEFTVRHSTLDDVVGAVAVRGTDPDDVAALKGDARVATVIRRALHGAIRLPTRPVSVDTRVGRWTVGADEFADLAADLIAQLRAGALRYGTARARLAGRIAESVRRRAEASGHFFTDGALRTLARGRAVREAVEAVWPRADAPGLVHRLLTDPAFLASAASGVLAGDEQRLLLTGAPRGGARTARWSLADAFCIDEARDLIESEPGFGHVIIDEAQDLSAMQCRALGRRCADGSATVLGDIAQGTTGWAATSWPTLLAHLGKPTAHLEVLTRGYRVPAE